MKYDRLKKYMPVGIFFLIALAVMWPVFFQGGYLFLLDMVWGPEIQLSDYLQEGFNANFPLTFLFKILSIFLPTALIQKTLLLVIFFLCGYLMFGFAKNIMAQRWAIISGVFYMLNPFVFERFLAGHWMVLLGYACFPFILLLFIRMLRSGRRKDIFVFMLAFSTYPIISLHWTYMAFWFLVMIGGMYFVKKINGELRDFAHLQNALFLRIGAVFKVFKFLLLQAVIFVAINYFWLVGFFNSGSTFKGISLNDFRAFSTLSDSDWGTFFNVLSLYGFWRDNFFLPKDMFVWWWMLTLIVFIFSLIGFLCLLKKYRILAVAMGLFFIVSLLVGVGYGDQGTIFFTDFLFYHLPGFGGMRDTEKAVGFIAFSYALLFPMGVEAAMGRIFAKTNGNIKKIAYNMSFLSVILFCCLLVNNMFFAFDGQLKAYDYPASWREVERLLVADTGKEKVLFLPWNGYMKLGFAGNENVANPARAFFGANVIFSKDPGSSYLADVEQGKVGVLVSSISENSNVQKDISLLKAEGISYIMLAKTGSWEKYQSLNSVSGLRKVFEKEEIVLYEVL